MLALVVDTSAHPKLRVTSVTMSQFPHTQGYPLMSYRPPATLTTGVSPL